MRAPNAMYGWVNVVRGGRGKGNDRGTKKGEEMR